MSSSFNNLWRKTLNDCRDQFQELGKSRNLDCVIWSPITETNPPPEQFNSSCVQLWFAQLTACRVYGFEDEWNRFSSIARRAFHSLNAAAADKRRRLDELAECDDFGGSESGQWVRIVADVALRKLPNVPLVAHKNTWRRTADGKGVCVQKLAELPALRELAQSSKAPSAVTGFLPDGTNWFVRLDDLANSSAIAIDAFLLLTADYSSTIERLRDAIQDVLFFAGRPDNAEFRSAASELRKATQAAFSNCPDLIAADAGREIETELMKLERSRQKDDTETSFKHLGRLSELQDWLLLIERYGPVAMPEGLTAATCLDDRPPPNEVNNSEVENVESQIKALETSTPPFCRLSSAWVKNSRAAELEGLETRTLADYRVKGIKNAGGTLGRDKDGRIWRKTGTPNSHPWYLRSSLVAK